MSLRFDIRHSGISVTMDWIYYWVRIWCTDCFLYKQMRKFVKVARVGSNICTSSKLVIFGEQRRHWNLCIQISRAPCKSITGKILLFHYFYWWLDQKDKGLFLWKHCLYSKSLSKWQMKHSGTCIKYLRYDRGGEYSSKEVQYFWSMKGIFH